MALEKNNEGCIQMGAAIRQIRESENMTLEDVASKIGVSRQTISKIEIGKWNASANHLHAIAGAIGYEWTLRKKQ